MYYWSRKKLNILSDQGISDYNIDLLGSKVNGQFPPKDANKRKDYTKKAYEVLQKVIKK